MPLKEIIDKYGRKFTWHECNGHAMLDKVVDLLLPQGLEARLEEIKNLEIRDDDIMVCTFPKAGTHWIWEIVSMVTKGQAEYATNTKTASMIDFIPIEVLNSLPSPRILNSHFSIECLPEQIFRKKIKIIHVYRNPKDLATSYYYHGKGFSWMFGEVQPFETFSEFLPYITGEYGVFSYVSVFRYFKAMERFSRENPGSVLNLHFEDMLQNSTDAVRLVAQFLNKDLSESVITDIADKCSFKNLKEAEEKIKTETDVVQKELTDAEEEKKSNLGPLSVYRKGTVGDWKNHFTVAQNEQFDKILESEFCDSDLKFTYSL